MLSFLDNFSYVFDNPLVTLVLLVYLIIATYTDVKYLKIYNKFNLSLVLVRILFLFIPIYSVKFSFENIIASVVVFVVMLTFGVMFMHKMGGDIKFLTAFMLFLDLEFMLVFMAISSVLNLLYSLLLKAYFIRQQKKVLEVNAKECKNNIEESNVIHKLNYLVVKLFMVKQPTLEEIAKMSKRDINKYKMPFAPFFLMSYVILMLSYHLCK